MKVVYQIKRRKIMIFVTMVSFSAALLAGCANPTLPDTLLQDQMFITDDNMDDFPEESPELHKESIEQEIESKEEVDTEAAESDDARAQVAEESVGEITLPEEELSLLVVQTVYDQEGTVILQYKYMYEYDEAGNQVRETHFDDNKRIGYREQSYDEFGNCVEMRYYDASGTINGFTQYEYNAAGNITKSEYYSGDELSIAEVYEYDEFGNETMRTVNSYSEGEVYSRRYMLYEYDVFGNQIKLTFFNEDTLEYIWEYTYDSSKNLVLETSYDAEGNVIWWHGYDYDEAGNLLEEISLSIRVEYSYDEFGNKVKEIVYDASGDFISQTEWSYE